MVLFHFLMHLIILPHYILIHKEFNMKSIKTVLLRRFLLIFAVLALCIFSGLMFGFRELTIKNAEDKALAIAYVIKAGLTAHMKNGMMSEKEYFLNEIQSTYKINGINIIRAPGINAQFGTKGILPQSDPTIQHVFNSKEEHFTLEEDDNVVRLKAYVPYIVNEKSTMDCTKCHNTKVGDVLGVVQMNLDLQEYKKFSIEYILMSIGVLMIFILFSLIHSIKSLNDFSIQPLRKLIARFEEAITEHKPIENSHFTTLEFRQAVNDINALIEKINHQKGELKLKNIELSDLNEEIEYTLKDTLFTIGIIAEKRSTETGNHLKRVSEISRFLALKYGVNEEDAELLYAASQLHDIGKLGIPDSILFKPARLDDDEYKQMQEHAFLGYEMLKNSQRILLQTSAIIAMEHHERWDGQGYPLGKKGEETTLFARIVCVADVLDALYSKRCYKEAWSFDEVMEYFKENSGKQFDPVLVELVLKYKYDIQVLFKTFNSFEI